MQKLIIDYDNTIINSTKAFCETYNKLFENCSDFKPADWTKSNVYNYADICPILEGNQEKVYKLFENSLFFKNAKFINDNTFDVIEKLNEKFDIHICSIGTGKNMYLKYNWLKKNLPFIKHHLFIMNEGCKMDKSIVNMEGAILIDDHTGNLETSNADMKISFGKRYSWNEDWKGIICQTWKEVETLIL
jgi:5'(3')-deoxyribonucleotidase